MLQIYTDEANQKQKIDTNNQISLGNDFFYNKEKERDINANNIQKHVTI